MCALPPEQAVAKSLREESGRESKEGARSRTVDSSLNIKVGVLISYLFLDARLFALILHMR